MHCWRSLRLKNLILIVVNMTNKPSWILNLDWATMRVLLVLILVFYPHPQESNGATPTVPPWARTTHRSAGCVGCYWSTRPSTSSLGATFAWCSQVGDRRANRHRRTLVLARVTAFEHFEHHPWVGSCRLVLVCSCRLRLIRSGIVSKLCVSCHVR
jgi:hypothetical protein